MSCFNVLLIQCPHCNSMNSYQSKAGSCSMDTYPLNKAEDVEIVDAANVSPHRCHVCRHVFCVDVHVIATIRLPTEDDLESYDDRETARVARGWRSQPRTREH